MNQAEIQNKFKLLELRDIQDLIELRAILTNIISVFPSAKHVPHFATKKFHATKRKDGTAKLNYMKGCDL